MRFRSGCATVLAWSRAARSRRDPIALAKLIRQNGCLRGSRKRASFRWRDAMRISGGLFLLAMGSAAALGYTAAQLRNSRLPFPSSEFAPRKPNLPSGQSYIVVVPNVDALIDHKKVSANPTRAEWQA